MTGKPVINNSKTDTEKETIEYIGHISYPNPSRETINVFFADTSTSVFIAKRGNRTFRLANTRNITVNLLSKIGYDITPTTIDSRRMRPRVNGIRVRSLYIGTENVIIVKYTAVSDESLIEARHKIIDYVYVRTGQTGIDNHYEKMQGCLDWQV
jgi:hypothetical protein